jgi:hypothetical protein
MALRGSGGKPRVVNFPDAERPGMDASGRHRSKAQSKSCAPTAWKILLTAVRRRPMEVMLEVGLAAEWGSTASAFKIDQALPFARELLSNKTGGKPD